MKVERRQIFLEIIFKSKVSKLSMLFIQILTKKKRESLLPQIAENFIQFYKAQKNIAVNCVTPAAAKTRIFDQMTE